MINRDDRFLRTEVMLGPENCERLRNTTIVVVGLGAVGSYAVEGLARAGVGHLRLVDFDRICITNINRQLLALDSTLGRPKCEVARERVLDINPNCRVEAINAFVDGETIRQLMADRPDIIIDAIDALNPKVELLETARTSGIAVISSLGAAMRFDPTQVRVAPLSDVQGCPLGRIVRTRLKRRHVALDFPCVYSKEPLPRPLPLLSPASVNEERVLRRGRERNTLGSLPTVTGIFGLTAASTAINILTGRMDWPEYVMQTGTSSAGI